MKNYKAQKYVKRRQCLSYSVSQQNSNLFYFRIQGQKFLFFCILNLRISINYQINRKFSQAEKLVIEVARNIEISFIQLMISISDIYSNAEGQKAQKWRSKSFEADEAQKQQQISKISNLKNNLQFNVAINTLLNLTNTKDKQKTSKARQKIDQIIDFSSKLSKVFENTYLSQNDGGDSKLVWLEINRQMFWNNQSNS